MPTQEPRGAAATPSLRRTRLRPDSYLVIEEYLIICICVVIIRANISTGREGALEEVKNGLAWQ